MSFPTSTPNGRCFDEGSPERRLLERLWTLRRREKRRINVVLPHKCWITVVGETVCCAWVPQFRVGETGAAQELAAAA